MTDKRITDGGMRDHFDEVSGRLVGEMDGWTAAVDRSDASDADFQQMLATIEATPAAEESFDAVAACRRVMQFATAYERGDIGDPGRAVVAWMIHVAIADAVVTTAQDRGEL